MDIYYGNICKCMYFCFQVILKTRKSVLGFGVYINCLKILYHSQDKFLYIMDEKEIISNTSRPPTGERFLLNLQTWLFHNPVNP